ncbi:hypothetical protein P3X46_015478 [Hevea brasiliensis]|uniref:Uncharacterized protein n=1 Tax=Hevea brasiliensis TaxID=3981 RepID=A0ABQ9LXZ2_HEVBR|nr:hypothetical protein P3X46_015478 [Hevea brasiliensis]
MNAFKAFKAQVPIAWSPNLYITLVRGIPGKGYSTGVKRLVVIETEEMCKARKQNEASHLALRSLLVISYLPVHSSSSS